jgi:hypothetical protein
MKSLLILLVLPAALLLSGCQSMQVSNAGPFSHFIGLDDFSNFVRSHDESGQIVLLSPVINSQIPWNQLVVSWNADAPPGTFVNVEASARHGDTPTKFYTLGQWSPDRAAFPRASVRRQNDSDGTVDTDTLILEQPASAVQVRITLGGLNGARPKLKFLGLSFANTKVPVAVRPPNEAVWGTVIATPMRSQHGYAQEKGWCSPTSLSMVLARWAEILDRPEMNLTVPQVAAAVYDAGLGGTGNWPFNTAFAGSFPHMRAYVTRFDDLAEVEDWIAAGLPVILSTRWDWLQPGRPPDTDGHLVVCIGFTENGDVVINDPATRLDRGESVQRIYKRDNVIHAWTKSHNTVYLVYPENWKIPNNDFGHW